MLQILDIDYYVMFLELFHRSLDQSDIIITSSNDVRHSCSCHYLKPFSAPFNSFNGHPAGASIQVKGAVFLGFYGSSFISFHTISFHMSLLQMILRFCDLLTYNVHVIFI